MRDKRIAIFDFYRVIAALTVAIVHFDGVPLKGNLADSSVDLFFVLSALLVGQPLLDAYKNEKQPDFKTFFIKRFTKIIPSYYFFIFLGLLLAVVFIKPISPENVIKLSELPEYLLFYRNLAGPPPRLTFEHVWSLCVEEQFYLVLPFAFLLAQRWFKASVKKLGVALLGVAVLGIAFKMQALVTNIAEWPTYTHNRIDAFAWGLLVLLFLNSDTIRNSTAFKRTQPLLAVAGSATFIFFSAIDLRETDPHDLILRSVSPFCWALIIAGTYHYKLFFATSFKKMAAYSYNLYLWHFLYVIPVAYYVGTDVDGFVIYLLLSCTSAVAATELVEKRFLAYRAPLLRYFGAANRSQAPSKAIS